ncbi:dGTP triphosphohydrolase [Laribacter hongkongensis]|uniref:dGTP triphosphohydrolase n=1 Tax=Laribacter hongkongensis TaxID=168471 RepID=UPI001EFCA4ED|nr:dNTP triphosphohydrolase [Laribacter hongkongensis]MCG9079171.1 dNTP triphosphohydrolase [Laribacter hongkongensis]
MINNDFKKLLELISEDRLRKSTSGPRGILIASESDKGRVINSGAFRRLQQKAQVFPLEPNASVRTRLTHSIEVSQVGRHLAQQIIKNQDGNSEGYEKLAAFVNIVETACLLHDIGNPPFGHLGEAAIKEWFKSEQECIKNMPMDLQNFDGNPQGFRLMAFLAGADNYGFNLTHSLLLSTVKYPWVLNDRPAAGKKIGLFLTEHEKYKCACANLNWTEGKKFPFMRLMDTADEIAYSMSDLEDGLDKKIITEDDLKREFGEYRFKTETLKPFIAFKTKVINDAVSLAAKNFSEKLEGILCGEEFDLIDKESEIGCLLKQVGVLARNKIYSDNHVEQVELAGRSVIKGLLNHFKTLLVLPEEDFIAIMDDNSSLIKSKNLHFQSRLLRRIPKSYQIKYKNEIGISEIGRRCHLIVDFISGMTDDFALETYQILEGIRTK